MPWVVFETVITASNLPKLYTPWFMWSPRLMQSVYKVNMTKLIFTIHNVVNAPTRMWRGPSVWFCSWLLGFVGGFFLPLCPHFLPSLLLTLFNMTRNAKCVWLKKELIWKAAESHELHWSHFINLCFLFVRPSMS
jgi:hypothetical protein